MQANIFQIVYRSTAVDSFEPSDMEKILLTARDYNFKHELTGLLICRSRSFLQLLEGPERTVRELCSRIQTDPRHQAVETLLECKSAERLYPIWSMAFVDETKAKGSVSQVFDLLDDVIKGSQDRAEMILPVLNKFKGAVLEIRP